MKTQGLILMVFLLTATLFIGGCVEKPPEFYPMPFGAQITFASGDMFIDIDELKEQLQVIEETGANVIRIDIDYEAWMTNDVDNINRHNELIDQIRNDGKKLMLADRGAASFTQNKVTWEYFKQQHLKHTRIFMEAYEPDYYVVVKEPAWYMDIDPMISTNTTPMMWYELALDACDIVKDVNPETKTAVAVYPSGRLARGFFELAADSSNLDIMGVDCYDTNDLQSTIDDLMSLVPDDKEIWMLESWNGGGGSYLQPWKKYADAKWIQGSVYYSQNNNFSGYICYYPIHFSSYTKLKDIDWSQRTPAFYAYKDVIEEVNGASTVANHEAFE